MKKKIIGVALASTIIFSGGITTVYADKDTSVDNKTPIEINNKIPLSNEAIGDKIEAAKEEKVDFLYVIDKENYREMVGKDTALFIIKDRMLIVDSEELSEEDIEKIKSSNEFYVIGELKNELKQLKNEDNFKAQLLGKDKIEDSIKLAEENGVDKDIIIANGNSVADSLTAIQVSKLKDMNVILIDDEIPDTVKEFIKKHGKEKKLSFVEGEYKINENTKKEILKLTGDTGYEINTDNFIKTGIVSKIINDEKEKNKSSKVNTVESLNVNNVNKNSLMNNLNPKMKDSIKNVAEKRTEENLDILNGKERVISLNAAEDIEDLSDVIANEAVKVIKNDKEKMEDLIQEINEDDEVSAHQLTLTNIEPVDSEQLKTLKEENKDHYIVPQKIDDKIVERVIDGEYGNGSERKEKLALEGYDYDKVQEKIREIAKAEREAREAEERAKAEREAREAEERAKAEREAREAEERAIREAIAQQEERQASYILQDSNSSNQSASSQKSAVKSNSAPKQQTQQSTANVESFINALTSMEGWTYSQPKRMQDGYADCSSIILRAMLKSGVTSNSANLTTSSIANDSRFYEVPMNQIKRGDILWKQGHTEVYMGGNSTFGAFKPGKPAGYAGGINRFHKAYRISGF